MDQGDSTGVRWGCFALAASPFVWLFFTFWGTYALGGENFRLAALGSALLIVFMVLALLAVGLADARKSRERAEVIRRQRAEAEHKREAAISNLSDSEFKRELSQRRQELAQGRAWEQRWQDSGFSPSDKEVCPPPVEWRESVWEAAKLLRFDHWVVAGYGPDGSVRVRPPKWEHWPSGRAKSVEASTTAYARVVVRHTTRDFSGIDIWIFPDGQVSLPDFVGDVSPEEVRAAIVRHIASE